MAPLETFDRIHQRPAVGMRVAWKSGIRREVAHESQKTGEAWHASIRLVRIDGLRNGRKLFPIVGMCQFDVACERLLSPAIACKRWFHLVQNCLKVRSGHDSVAYKLGQVVSLLLRVQSKLEMLWIDPSDAQVGHIAHGADGEGHVETRHCRYTSRALQSTDSLLPPRTVVILRVEPLLPRISEKFDQQKGLRQRLRPLRPGRSESRWPVELLNRVAIVAEVRPSHLFEVAARNQGPDVNLLPGADMRQGHNKKSGSPLYPSQVAHKSGSHLTRPDLVAHGWTPLFRINVASSGPPT